MPLLLAATLAVSSVSLATERVERADLAGALGFFPPASEQPEAIKGATWRFLPPGMSPQTTPVGGCAARLDLNPKGCGGANTAQDIRTTRAAGEPTLCGLVLDGPIEFWMSRAYRGRRRDPLVEPRNTNPKGRARKHYNKLKLPEESHATSCMPPSGVRRPRQHVCVCDMPFAWIEPKTSNGLCVQAPLSVIKH